MFGLILISAVVTLQEVAGANGQLGAPGGFSTCSPSQATGSTLAQGSLPLLKRNQPDASAFQQLLQTGVLVKDLYLSAGQQSDCNVFGLISPGSPGSSNPQHRKHTQTSIDLSAESLHNWQRRTSPLDVKPAATSDQLPPANAVASNQQHAVLQVKTEDTMCQLGPCIQPGMSNNHGWQLHGCLPQQSAVGVPSAHIFQFLDSHPPIASTAKAPGGLAAETAGEEHTGRDGSGCREQSAMSALVSGQTGLLAAVAAQLAAKPATSVEGCVPWCKARSS